jgi:hypothetical protein
LRKRQVRDLEDRTINHVEHTYIHNQPSAFQVSSRDTLIARLNPPNSIGGSCLQVLWCYFQG